MSLFGRSYGQGISGRVRIEGGMSMSRPSARRSRRASPYVTEDRKQLGLVLEETITKNTTLANLPGVSTAAVIDEDKERQVATDYRTKMRIRSFGVAQQTVNLSGGNQQRSCSASGCSRTPRC